MKAGKSQAKVQAAEPDEPKLWQKTSYANLVRYNPSGTYFCRIRVRGKLIRKTLHTDVLSVAKLRLTHEEKKHRQAAQRQQAIQRGRGQMTFGDALGSISGKQTPISNPKPRITTNSASTHYCGRGPVSKRAMFEIFPSRPVWTGRPDMKAAPPPSTTQRWSCGQCWTSPLRVA